MVVTSNLLMRDLVGALASCPDTISVRVPEKMLQEIGNGFEEIDGCVVAKGWFGKSIKKEQNDETGIACPLSKIHVDDFVDTSMPLKDLVRVGIAFVLRLKQALIESTVRGPFRIIVSGDSAGHSCTVRFHRFRPGQAWLDSDLEHYESNSVMSIDFDSPDTPGDVS